MEAPRHRTPGRFVDCLNPAAWGMQERMLNTTPPPPLRGRAGVGGHRGTDWGVSPLTPTLVRFAAQAHKGRGGATQISAWSYPMSGEPNAPSPLAEEGWVGGPPGTDWGVQPLTPTLSRKGRGG